MSGRETGTLRLRRRARMVRRRPAAGGLRLGRRELGWPASSWCRCSVSRHQEQRARSDLHDAGQPAAGRARPWGKRNFWLAEGFSGGILMPGGIGHELAEWIIEGEPDASTCRRSTPEALRPLRQQALELARRSKEAFGHNFGIHYPGYEWPAATASPARPMPCYDRLSEPMARSGARSTAGRCPLWFAPEGRRAPEGHLELPDLQLQAPCRHRVPWRFATMRWV